MTDTNHDELMRYSAGDLAKTFFVKICKRKRIKLIVSSIAVPASVRLATVLRSHGWYGSQFDVILPFMVFTMLIMSIAYFVSNIGKPKGWKYVISASVSTAILWPAVSFYEVYTGYDPSQPDGFWNMVRGAALAYIPIFLLALGAVLILGRLLFGKKKQA